MNTDPTALLRGAIDMHIHSSPDLVARKQSDIELVRSARDAGLRAIVLKCHYALTADRAAIAASVVPGIQVFGGLVLNAPCGGFNPRAVDTALGFGAKVIWMPTVSAANHLHHLRTGDWNAHVHDLTRDEGDGISILDGTGALRPEIATICGLIARAGAILATGHLSWREIRVLIPAAQRQGVERIVVTHPEVPMINIPLPDQRALAAEGIFFERCLYSTCMGIPVRSIAEAVAAVGPESTVLATDFGQAANPPAVEAMASYLGQLQDEGLTDADLRRMTRDNPAHLLGLPKEDA